MAENRFAAIAIEFAENRSPRKKQRIQQRKYRIRKAEGPQNPKALRPKSFCEKPKA
jgi:hypothetical protein